MVYFLGLWEYFAGAGERRQKENTTLLSLDPFLMCLLDQSH
jgi:hypothetical protein